MIPSAPFDQTQPATAYAEDGEGGRIADRASTYAYDTNGRLSVIHPADRAPLRFNYGRPTPSTSTIPHGHRRLSAEPGSSDNDHSTTSIPETAWPGIYTYDASPRAFAPPRCAATDPLPFTARNARARAPRHDYGATTISLWLSRDPIAERGGVNLYGFVFNSPVGFVDRLGLDPVSTESGSPAAAGPLTPYERSRYAGYNESCGVGSYNCAGLANRTYDATIISVEKLRQSILAAGGRKLSDCRQSCKEGEVKQWIWEYTLRIADSEGRTVQIRDKNSNAVFQLKYDEFHTVAGLTGAGGIDPAGVYSKDGGRPVSGPSGPESFRPPGQEPYTSNTPSPSPVLGKGKPLVRYNEDIKESCYCIPSKPCASSESEGKK